MSAHDLAHRLRSLAASALQKGDAGYSEFETYAATAMREAADFISPPDPAIKRPVRVEICAQGFLWLKDADDKLLLGDSYNRSTLIEKYAVLARALNAMEPTP